MKLLYDISALNLSRDLSTKKEQDAFGEWKPLVLSPRNCIFFPHTSCSGEEQQASRESGATAEQTLARNKGRERREEAFPGRFRKGQGATPLLLPRPDSTALSPSSLALLCYFTITPVKLRGHVATQVTTRVILTRHFAQAIGCSAATNNLFVTKICVAITCYRGCMRTYIHNAHVLA